MKRMVLCFFLLSSFNSFANFDFSEMEFIEKANNPFQVVGAHPGTPVTELDETTLRTIRRITGWNILDLNKFMDEQRLEHSIRELTEREGNTIKKILDSHFVLKHIHEKKALIRFNLFGKEFKLGSDALEVLKSEEIRDLKIYYKNELGHFQIEWGSVDVSLSKDIKNNPGNDLILTTYYDEESQTLLVGGYTMGDNSIQIGFLGEINSDNNLEIISEFEDVGSTAIRSISFYDKKAYIVGTQNNASTQDIIISRLK